MINRAPLRITDIPQPLGDQGTQQAVADYIGQLIAAIKECNADKEAAIQ